MRTRELLQWAAVVALFIAAALLLREDVRRLHERAITKQAGRARIGMPAPDLTLFRLDGSPVRLRAYFGRPLWINFWATWCPPCEAELPDIERLYEQNRSRGLVVLGADQEETPGQVIRFAKPRGLRFPLVIDHGEATLTYDVAALPTSVFIDAGGIVRSIHVGQMSAARMREALQTILP